MSKEKKNFYQEIAEENEGIEAKNVKNIFVWYDLFSFALSFQIIYIISASFGWNFSATIISAAFVILTDTILKLSLTKNGKNYEKLNSQLALVKLWTIPLMFLGVATIVALIIVTFGLI